MDYIIPDVTIDILTPSVMNKEFNVNEFEDGVKIDHGKPLMLELLRRRHNIASENVVFFDDELENIRSCHSAGFNRAYHTPCGFTREAISGLTF